MEATFKHFPTFFLLLIQFGFHLLWNANTSLYIILDSSSVDSIFLFLKEMHIDSYPVIARLMTKYTKVEYEGYWPIEWGVYIPFLCEQRNFRTGNGKQWKLLVMWPTEQANERFLSSCIVSVLPSIYSTLLSFRRAVKPGSLIEPWICCKLGTSSLGCMDAYLWFFQ